MLQVVGADDRRKSFLAPPSTPSSVEAGALNNVSTTTRVPLRVVYENLLAREDRWVREDETRAVPSVPFVPIKEKTLKPWGRNSYDQFTHQCHAYDDLERGGYKGPCVVKRRSRGKKREQRPRRGSRSTGETGDASTTLSSTVAATVDESVVETASKQRTIETAAFERDAKEAVETISSLDKLLTFLKMLGAGEFEDRRHSLQASNPDSERLLETM